MSPTSSAMWLKPTARAFFVLGMGLSTISGHMWVAYRPFAIGSFSASCIYALSICMKDRRRPLSNPTNHVADRTERVPTYLFGSQARTASAAIAVEWVAARAIRFASVIDLEPRGEAPLLWENVPQLGLELSIA